MSFMHLLYSPAEIARNVGENAKTLRLRSLVVVAFHLYRARASSCPPLGLSVRYLPK